MKWVSTWLWLDEQLPDEQEFLRNHRAVGRHIWTMAGFNVFLLKTHQSIFTLQSCDHIRSDVHRHAAACCVVSVKNRHPADVIESQKMFCEGTTEQIRTGPERSFQALAPSELHHQMFYLWEKKKHLFFYLWITQSISFSLIVVVSFLIQQ